MGAAAVATNIGMGREVTHPGHQNITTNRCGTAVHVEMDRWQPVVLFNPAVDAGTLIIGVRTAVQRKSRSAIRTNGLICNSLVYSLGIFVGLRSFVWSFL